MIVTTRLERALVTGASAGIGEEFARQLAARGVDLVLVARREDRLRSLRNSLAEHQGVEVEVVAADLTTPDGLEAVEARLRQLEAPVDLLVSNAGFGAYGKFSDLALDQQQSMVELNVTAVVRLAHAILPSLRQRQRGGVINVASTAAFQPNPHGAVYGATKAFVLNFSQALHEEVREDGIRVTALCPGYTETEYQQVAEVDEHGVPDVTIMQVEPVVKAGLDGFTRGRAVVVPGTLNKLGAAGASMGPSAVARKISGLLHARYAGR